MKGFRLHQQGSLDGLRVDDIPEPSPGDNEVLVRVVSTSINYRDYATITGTYPLGKPLPLVLGSDAAGVVEQTGKNVTKFKPGDKVISLLRQRWHAGKFDSYKASVQLAGSVDGVFTEFYSSDEMSLVKAPESLTWEESATLPTAGLAAFRILTQSGITAGDVVLIQGTGGVSVFALQIARAMGFRIIATTGNEWNEEFLHHLGAHQVINYKDHPRWQDQALAMTNSRGVDLVIDVVGGDSVQRSIDAAAVSGQVALVGFLENTSSTIDLVSVIRRNIHLKAYTTGSREDLEQFVRFVDANVLKPDVHPLMPGNA